MGVDKKLPKDKPLRDDDCTRVLITIAGNGLIMKIDDPCCDVVNTQVYELESEGIVADLNRTDPEKVQKFLYDLMDVLSIHPSDSAKKKLSIVVEDRKLDER